MKFKTNFEEMKKAVAAIGKVAKRNGMDEAFIKIEAKEKFIALSSSGTNSTSTTMGVVITVPAEVDEEGVFIAKMSSINMLTIRKCTGNITAKRSEDNAGAPLSLSYRNGMASMSLASVDESKVFINVPDCGEKAVKLSAEMLKDMCKRVSFAAADDTSEVLHSLRMRIEEDVDEVLKVSLAACNRITVAVRTAFTVKDEDCCTGEVLILPEHLMTAMDVLDTDEEVSLYIQENKIQLMANNVRVVLPVMSWKFANIEGILSKRDSSFSVTLNKQELLEALACVRYVSQEHKVSAESFESSVSIKFSEKSVLISNVGMNQYSERIEAKTEGVLPNAVFFNASLLKNVVEAYPSDEITFGGTNANRPFWACCGDNDEYVYCLMPRERKS